MNLEAYIDDIKLQLTGGVVGLEVSDEDIGRLVNSALRRVQRFINTTTLLTTDFKSCIKLDEVEEENNIKISAVMRIFRADSYMTGPNGGVMDPVYASKIQLLSGAGGVYNLNNWTYDFAAWNTMNQLKNTMSTDMHFDVDKQKNEIYINTSGDTPSKITLEYIPRFDNVEDIKSDYWIDIITKVSLALVKIALGRIRTKYKQTTGSLWETDGDKMLEEGNNELKELDEYLRTNTDISVYDD